MGSQQTKGNDQKNVREALKRRKASKEKWQTFQHIFWVLLALLLVGGAVIMVYVLPERKSSEIPVNDEALINHVNNQRSSFSAASSSNFDGWLLADVKKSLGGVFWTKGMGHVPVCRVANLSAPATNYDLREEHPECFTAPYESYNCSSSWAVGAATMLGNRFCMADPDKYAGLRLSPQDILSCDTLNGGCAGGSIDSLWVHIQREGIVTEKCFPYQGKSSPAVRCKQKCIADEPFHISSYCRIADEVTAQQEIMTNGPVLAILPLHNDFLIYSSGVYKPLKTAKQLFDSERRQLTHAVKVIGWGVEGGLPYWLVENNFGETWGDRGFAKVYRGDSEVLFEIMMVSAELQLPGEESADGDAIDIDNEEAKQKDEL